MIRKLNMRRNAVLRHFVTGLMIFGVIINAFANPTGLTVGSGTATIRQNGSQMTITASHNAFLNWQRFNIAAGETTIFNQPSASSVVWNRVNDPNPSQIFGNLQANGVVVLLNSSGFYFGPHSFVSAAGLVVSTANYAPPENGGGPWEFNGPPPLASIINYGHIQIGNGGQAFLIANHIENHGTIEAPGGTIGLAAGQTVLLSERPDGRGMSLQVRLPQGSVDNYGNLIADAGTISLNARVINQDGLLQANSVRNQNGVIELVASDSINLGADSQISARGDDLTPGSTGGTVTLQSENNFSDSPGGQIVVSGGTQGGDGGSIEVSAPNVLSLDSHMDATAQPGSSGGTFFLDPVNIILGTSTAGGAINVNTAFAGFSEIILQATANITLNAGTAWNLSTSTGNSSGHLTLEAGGNIIFSSTSSQVSSITDPNNWSLTLNAGYNFVNNTVQSGVGNIYLNGGSGQTGGGFIRLGAGNVELVAGQNILVGRGYVNTTGGGSIFAHALAGNIDTGSRSQGYIFQSATAPGQGYYVDSGLGLGGMSTAAGGDVTLIAGGNVSSVLPGNNGYYYNGSFVATGGTDGTAGSGTYGSQAGDVTVIAGGNVTGHYLVANGTGSIYAGVRMDANGNPLTDGLGDYLLGTSGSAGTTPSRANFALSLINGGWNVTAAQNIILQEVRNPNGIFNINNGGAYHYFNYDPAAYVNLSAGNLIQLGGATATLPRLSSSDSLRVPVIYPPTLDISAGAGGIVLVGDSTYNQLILFPSPQGSLILNTTQGGSLVGNLPTVNNTPQIFSLIVSDSDRHQFTRAGQFGLNDHGTTPIHLNNPTPIELNISGDMSLVLLGAPEAAQINVSGDMNNSRFQGMNLSANDTTSINVAGDIINRSPFTSLDLSTVPGSGVPNLAYLAQAQTVNPSAATLSTSFYYDPLTHTLTYQNITGQSLASVLNLLQNLPVQKYINGVPQWADPPYNTIPVIQTVSVFNTATSQALQNKYDADNIANGLVAGVGPPSSALGFVMGGGGRFNITAHDMDLGTTAGIQSRGVSLYNVNGYYPLAQLFNTGSDISVNLTGDLNMYSTSIASLNGGNIAVNVGGDVNAGSSQFTVNTIGARGIYTTSHGNVSVIAGGDININGSRIATYDGGNVTVRSENGNVDAGNGGSGYVIVQKFSVHNHQVTASTATIPGSGILATTFPDSTSSVGNILVETPNGNIIANSGGIVQIALNQAQNSSALLPPFFLTVIKNLMLAPNPNPSVASVILSFVRNLNQVAPPNSFPNSTQIALLRLAQTFYQAPNPNPIVISRLLSLIQNQASNPNATVTLLAGYELQNGNPVSISSGRDINVSGSGVIAQDAVLKATGSIYGLIFARGNIDLSAQKNVNANVLGQGNVIVHGGDQVSGVIIGVGGVSASGGSIDASLLSSGAISGQTSGL